MMVKFNNYELSSVGIILANILDYMCKHNISNYNTFLKIINISNVPYKTFYKGTNNTPSGVLKYMLNPDNNNVSNSGTKLLDNIKGLINEFAHYGYMDYTHLRYYTLYLQKLNGEDVMYSRSKTVSSYINKCIKKKRVFSKNLSKDDLESVVNVFSVATAELNNKYDTKDLTL